MERAAGAGIERVTTRLNNSREEWMIPILKFNSSLLAVLFWDGGRIPPLSHVAGAGHDGCPL